MHMRACDAGFLSDVSDFISCWSFDDDVSCITSNDTKRTEDIKHVGQHRNLDNETSFHNYESTCVAYLNDLDNVRVLHLGVKGQ